MIRHNDMRTAKSPPRPLPTLPQSLRERRLVQVEVVPENRNDGSHISHEVEG